jgi:hypothetical protein
MTILHSRPQPASKTLPCIPCATCSSGRVQNAGASCRACWDEERREQATRARSRRAGLVQRLAALAECRPDELVELLVEIGQSARGGAA